MSERADMWAEIESAALAQVRAELERDERTPLEFGYPIVWSECLMGRTNGMSELHRVGLPQHGHQYTTCGQLIPPPIRRVPLSPATIRVMVKCRQCEAEVVRISRERAA
jgi:hypothetical protein